MYDDDDDDDERVGKMGERKEELEKQVKSQRVIRTPGKHPE